MKATFIVLLSCVALTLALPHNNRIVGGTLVPRGQAPYQVSLRTHMDQHFCGGAILAQRWVLTSGHCVAGRQEGEFVAVAGSVSLRDGTGNIVTKVFVHPEFVADGLQNDIALLQVEANFVFNMIVQPAKIGTDFIEDLEVVLTGWGQTTYPGTLSEDLQGLVMNTITNEECKTAHENSGGSPAITETNIWLPSPSFLSHRTLKNGDNAFFVPLGNNSSTSSRKGRRRVVTVSRASTAPVPPFKFFEPPKAEESSLLSELEPADPDFYKIGYVRSMRAYGVEFMEGPNGFGVYASKDVEPLRRARVIMEIPLELMLTISQKLPWMFFPDIIPVGHPIFDIINSTKPETDWDLRLACLLLYSFDVEGNFWQLYGDFLPSPEECTSLLLAHKDDLLELQDTDLASKMEEQQKRAIEFWEKHWHSAAPLKIKRLACDAERFLWALSIVQSRAVNMQIRVGALVQDANMLVPYADMLNHSFQPNCFLHWRFKDRMLEVMINAGQRIKKGEEMTINYMSGQKNNIYMERYGFSSPTNPWDVINFSSNAKIHLDSYLSVFNISGLPEEFYHNSLLSSEEDNKFVDGAVIAAARTLPTWSDGDVPPVPSTERRSARELQEDCYRLLLEFPTTLEQDWQILDSNPDASRTCEAAIKYRLHRKLFLKKVIQALELYQERILF